MISFVRKYKVFLGALLLMIFMMAGSSCKAKKRKVTCYLFVADERKVKTELHENHRT